MWLDIIYTWNKCFYLALKVIKLLLAYQKLIYVTEMPVTSEVLVKDSMLQQQFLRLVFEWLKSSFYITKIIFNDHLVRVWFFPVRTF